MLFSYTFRHKSAVLPLLNFYWISLCLFFWCRKSNKNMWYKRKREYHSAILSIVVGQTLNLNNLAWRKRHKMSFSQFQQDVWNRNKTLILFHPQCRAINWCYKIFLINMQSFSILQSYKTVSILVMWVILYTTDHYINLRSTIKNILRNPLCPT